MATDKLTEVRISLSEKDFADLVAGKIVIPERAAIGHDSRVPMFTESIVVKIALQDIGWDRMYAALDMASIREAEQ